jgi:bifunctional N-acetylglucosamine-1-phosphate-uridyltransferase/glucosamine-1-phosphate-acetyltransferase GlmU-like protein
MIVDWKNLEQFAAPEVVPAEWTAVIPAAGRASRLAFDQPKILYPVAGRTILEWLLDFVAPNCSRIVIVLSPGGREAVEPELERLIPGRFETVIQEVPLGMGDAVQAALPAVRTPRVALIWGDQVALQRASVEACLRLHAGPLAPAVTCPTVVRAHPYIHFDRDADGTLSGLRQAREGDDMPDQGESDTGFFCFQAAALRALLAACLADPNERGRSTGEVNLLPVIPLAARRGLTVLTPHLMTLAETVGINSAADAQLVESYLHSSHASPGRRET